MVVQGGLQQQPGSSSSFEPDFCDGRSPGGMNRRFYYGDCCIVVSISSVPHLQEEQGTHLRIVSSYCHKKWQEH